MALLADGQRQLLRPARDRGKIEHTDIDDARLLPGEPRPAASDKGKIVFTYLRAQVQVINRFTEDHARLEKLKLRRRLRRGVRDELAKVTE